MKDLEVAELRNLALCFMHRCRIGQGLGDGLAFHFESEARIRTVTRVVGTVAVASGLTAPARSGGDGPRTQVAQSRNLVGDLGTGA